MLLISGIICRGFFFHWKKKNNFHSSNTIWVKILRGIILGYLVRRQVHLSNFLERQLL